MPTSPRKGNKQVITERDVIQVWKERRSRLVVPFGTLVTPAAKDAAKARRIELVDERESRQTSAPAPESRLQSPPSLGPIVIGSDHAGYQLKEQVKSYLRDLGYRYDDVGTFSEASVDYPDIARQVAEKVASKVAQRGIMIDGAGVGSAIAANKVPGVRAAALYDTYTARNSREHNNTNVLCLGSRNTGVDTVKEILKVWLSTDFGGGRHLRRLEKIAAIESNYSRTS